MSWLDLLVNEIGNKLLPKTANKNVGIIADKFFSKEGNIIYSYDNKEIQPQNQNTLLGFHVLDQLTSSEVNQTRIIKGVNFDLSLSLILIGNEKLDKGHILDIASLINQQRPSCKGVTGGETTILKIDFDNTTLIDKHFKQYKEMLIQKQTGIKIYEIQYKINAKTSFKI